MIYSKTNQIGIGKKKGRVAIQIASWWKEAAIEKEPDKTQTCGKVSPFLPSSPQLCTASLCILLFALNIVQVSHTVVKNTMFMSRNCKCYFSVSSFIRDCCIRHFNTYVRLYRLLFPSAV